MQETQSLGWEDPLEKGMATHSSIPAWRIPWTEEPGGPQSMGLHRVIHDWANERDNLSLCHEDTGRRPSADHEAAPISDIQPPEEWEILKPLLLKSVIFVIAAQIS